jgi:hypothetical protein
MSPKKKVTAPVLDEEEIEQIESEEVEQPAPQPVRAKLGIFIAYAPFDFDGEHYEPGDEFTPRKSWTRDTAFEEFRSIERKKGADAGIAFMVPGAIIDKKTQERAYDRTVLPLKEA